MSRGYRAVYGGGKLVAEYQDGVLTYVDAEYWERKRSTLAAPVVMKDIGEYTSPLDGQRITSRSQHRDHVRAHNVIEVGNEPIRDTRVEPKIDKKEIGRTIKNRLDEVRAMPERQYREHVQKQRAEHEAVASLSPPTPAI